MTQSTMASNELSAVPVPDVCALATSGGSDRLCDRFFDHVNPWCDRFAKGRQPVSPLHIIEPAAINPQ
jgi:hypothetical protein